MFGYNQNNNRTRTDYFHTKNLNPGRLVELPEPPSDSISKLSWCPTKNLLAASSWNNSVSVWKIEMSGNNVRGVPIKRYNHTAPVLSCFFCADGKILSAGCDNIGKVFNLGGQNIGSSNSSCLDFGKHDSCIKTIHHAPKMNIVITGGWDKKVKFWDYRFSNSNPVMVNNTPERVYAADAKLQYLVVGCGGKNRPITIFDLRKPQQPVKTEQSPLRLQTRCLSIFPDVKGYVIGSIEGRVGVQNFIENNYKKKSFAFKCHREGSGKIKRNCFAINDIDFHPKFGTFATCGSNGRYHFWNKDEKRRVWQMKSKISCPITSGKFNGNGQIYAVAVSYDFSQGTEVDIFKSRFGSKILLQPSNQSMHN